MYKGSLLSRLFTPATTTSSKWPRASGGGQSSRPNNVTNLLLGRITALVLLFSVLAACGSSGGTAQPPSPSVPATPPAPPPPDPTFEERLAEWAEHDPNACRAQTPGFEALGGWLKNDGRELGPSRVWIDDVSELSDSSGHGAQVWSTFTACAVSSTQAQFFTDAQALYRAQEEDGRDAIESLSLGLVRPPDESDPYPAPDYLEQVFDGMRDGLRLLRVQGAGNDDGLITSELWDANFQAALEAKDTALRILVAGYTGKGDDRRPHPESSICGEADSLCLYGPYEEGGKAGTSIATPQVAAALDTVWAILGAGAKTPARRVVDLDASGGLGTITGIDWTKPGNKFATRPRQRAGPEASAAGQFFGVIGRFAPATERIRPRTSIFRTVRQGRGESGRRATLRLHLPHRYLRGSRAASTGSRRTDRQNIRLCCSEKLIRRSA